MQSRLASALLFLCLTLVATAVHSVAAMAPGAIWAAKVEGNAWIESGARTRLAEGATINAGATIVTEANGNVVLLFENGSTVNIRPGSKFSIKEFSCEPFDKSKVDWRSLRSEPGESSRTKVRIDDGSIIANVRKLRGGSTYAIETPLGTAGIRGTTVYAEVDMQNGNNPVSFGVANGSADFTSTSGQTQTLNGGTATSVSSQGQFTPPPASAQQSLSTAQQVGQTMTQVSPPPTTGDSAGAGAAPAPGAQSSASGPQSTGASSAAGGPVATASEGTVTVIKDGAQSDGAENLNTLLAPGTIITTGEDGAITIEIAPGIVIQLQPNTQITIGQRLPDNAVNEEGDSIPETTIRLAVGSIIVNSTASALAANSFVIETARGNISAVTAGSMVVSSTGADPTTATVTVAAIVGNKLAVTTEGEQLPVAEGLVVILRPDGIEYGGIQDFPDLASTAGVSPPVSLPPAALPPPPPPSPSPTPTPTPSPTPSPTPTPTPTPGPISP